MIRNKNKLHDVLSSRKKIDLVKNFIMNARYLIYFPTKIKN